MTNNQMKCRIIYEKIAMWVGDDEQMIIMSSLNMKSQKDVKLLKCVKIKT